MNMKVAVIQFPGSNCEEETRYACEVAGMETEIFHWLRNPSDLHNFAGFILPGGFAHQDRVRAGAIAAKEPIMALICELGLKGRAVLGICNGAQVLVESGLIPGLTTSRVEMALADNMMIDRWGFFHKFIFCNSTSQKGSSLINQTIDEGIVISMPVAHAEGRFTTISDEVKKNIERGVLSSFKYCNYEGTITDSFPTNPNGAIYSLSALSNKEGNIVAIMPHPERSAFLRQLTPDLPGKWGEIRRNTKNITDKKFGPGMEIFLSFKKYIE